MIYFLGLDPARPLFYKFDPAVRIDSQDVVFVDIIHTDGTQYIHGSSRMHTDAHDQGFNENTE